jgi:hypothetical protein
MVYLPLILRYNNTMDQDQLNQDIGYIKAKVEGIEKLEKKIDNLDTRLDRVDKSMSKIIGYATGAGAVVSVIIVFTKDFFTNLLN